MRKLAKFLFSPSFNPWPEAKGISEHDKPSTPPISRDIFGYLCQVVYKNKHGHRRVPKIAQRMVRPWRLNQSKTGEMHKGEQSDFWYIRGQVLPRPLWPSKAGEGGRAGEARQAWEGWPGTTRQESLLHSVAGTVAPVSHRLPLFYKLEYF